MVNDPGPASAAWQELLEVLARADRSFLDPGRFSFNDAELAYGYRNLLHVAAFGLGMYMNIDRDWPTFAPSPKDPPGEKTLGEHPDVYYRWAAIRGDRRYQIIGQRGDEVYLSFTVHRGARGSGFDQYFDSHLSHHDLEMDHDGRFEIVVSPEPEGPNWLRISPDANEIYARAYHFDPMGDRLATYEIEPVGAPPPERLSCESVADRLREMARLVADVTQAMPQPLSDANTVGDLWKPEGHGPSRMWSAIDNVYNRGVFRLEPSQALVIEGVVVPCDYWGIQLWSPFLGSGNYRSHPVSINTAQATLGASGEFRVAIARQDPKVPGLDWVSTAGERQGTFFIRWMCPETTPPMPTCEVWELAELSG
jgi:hypothetical protein